MATNNATLDKAPRSFADSPRRHGRTRRRAGIWVALAAVLALTSTLLAPGPSRAADAIPSACPELTDSVRRVFIALFLREPDVNEAFYWTDRYMSGRSSLPDIAGSLIRSREFEERYGRRTSSDFVELMYRNTRRPSPTPAELSTWARSLDTGLPRGDMVLTLVETEDFVAKTATAKPLAGYLRWYPAGTHWYCGSGARYGLSIKPLTGSVVFADRLIRNDGDDVDDVTINTVEAGLPNVVIARGALAPGVTDYRWFSAIVGDGYYGAAVDIDVGPSTRWMIVFYDQRMGDSRLGWQIGDPEVQPNGNGL